MRSRALLLLLLLIPSLLNAQYIEEWQVPQDFYERGILHFDYNKDGYVDLTKMLGNVVTVYDGTDQYSVLWTITENSYENLVIWDTYEIQLGTRLAVFVASNIMAEEVFRLQAYEILGEQYSWTTTEYDGSYSYIAADDIDGDTIDEIVFGVNEYVDGLNNFLSCFYVLDGLSGTLEYASSSFPGLMLGPYLGDLDGDDTVEILFNIYDYSLQASTLHVYGSPEAVELEPGPLQPRDIRLGQNYPNPFNLGTRIPLRLIRPAQVRLTVYDINGRRISEILNSDLPAGQYQFHWNGLTDDGHEVTSGIYFYEIECDGHPVRRPMVLLK